MTTLLLAAGDASGDLHAAEFVRRFRERRPETRFAGLGGREMQRAGVELCADQRNLAVGGFLELVGSGRRIASVWRRMGSALDELQPDLVVLIDSGGFNLPLARRARKRSGAPILYYVAPQVWAWRRGRIRKLARRVDRVAVIFPFEPAFYARAEVEVEFVGHPLVDRLRAFRQQWSAGQAREALGLRGAPRWLALLPGSRRNELRQQLPLQLEAARHLHRADPGVGFLLAVAPTLPIDAVERALRRARLPDSLRLRVIEDRTHLVIRAADVVLTKPGTSTLEAVLLERPMVVMGRVSPLTAAVLRRAVKLPHYAMPNLIAAAEVVPEFLQERARPAAMAGALARLFEGPARTRQLRELASVEARLGGGGAARRAAAIAEEMLAPVCP